LTKGSKHQRIFL